MLGSHQPRLSGRRSVMAVAIAIDGTQGAISGGHELDMAAQHDD
jgi:hypothetical protein